VDAASVKDSFTFTLSHFYTNSYNKDNGSLECGAGYRYAYSRPDGTTFTHDQGDILFFEVHQGEDGLDSSMTGNEISAISGIQYQLAGDGSDQ
jgi:hypothetical protein